MTAIDTHAHDHPQDDHDHAHHPKQGHHWSSMQQQFEAGKLGMWLFIATEFLLFGGLFCAYAVYRHNHPEIFEYGSQFLDTKWGAINTVILIASSLTMALGVSAAQLGKKGPLVILLGLTILGGAGFMAIKYVEYKHKFEGNIVWGPGFYEPTDLTTFHAPETYAGGLVDLDPAEQITTEDGFMLPMSANPAPADSPQGLVLGGGEHEEEHVEEAHADDQAHEGDAHALELDPRTDPDRPANAHVFFGIYFCMTGLHGLHVLIGMSVIGWLMFRGARGEFGPSYFTPVDLGGLYWHVVDMIWIFLFPLLYLI